MADGLKAIDEAGATTSTLVMMLSEQGTSQPGAKWNLYDLGIQSACVVRWPGVVKPGSVSDAMVEYVDVVPTFVEAAGGKPTPELDGRSFLGVLQGKTDKHKSHVFAIQTTRGVNGGSDHYGIRSVRSATHKLIWNLTPGESLMNGSIRGDTFRSWVTKADAGSTAAKAAVERYLHRPEYELYDAVADPFEQKNLAGDAALAGVKAGLRSKLEAWMKQQGDLGQATEMEALQHQKASRQKKATRETSGKARSKPATKAKKADRKQSRRSLQDR